MPSIVKEHLYYSIEIDEMIVLFGFLGSGPRGALDFDLIAEFLRG